MAHLVVSGKACQRPVRFWGGRIRVNGLSVGRATFRFRRLFVLVLAGSTLSGRLVARPDGLLSSALDPSSSGGAVVEGDDGRSPGAVPVGLGMGGRSKLTVGGYYRTEFRYQVPNVMYGYDVQLGVWLPRGSPYVAFGLVPSAEADAYAEANLELTWDPLDPVSLYADTSFIFSTLESPESVFEQAQDALVGAGVIAPEDVATSLQAGVPIPGYWPEDQVRPAGQRLQINELYASFDAGDWVSITVGKRRRTWGTAFTWDPIDVVNPRFNPFEPTLLREGAYTATLDLTHYYRFGLTLLYRPSVHDNDRGLPVEWDFGQALFAGRVYGNVFQSDVNLVAYRDRGRIYGGFAFSRYFGDVEIHLESLIQRGRPTWLVEEVTGGADSESGQSAPYAVDQFDMARCRTTGDCGVWPDIVVGARRTFDSGASLLFEYWYHGRGYDAAEYDAYRGFTAFLEEALPRALTDWTDSGDVSDEASMQSWADMVANAPYLYQETNVRRHYASLSFLGDEIAGFLEPRVTGICNLDDGSVIVYPAANLWMRKGERGPGTLSVFAGVMVFLGGPETQVALYPSRLSVNVRATARF